jgi:hypothetical protein
MTDSYHGTRCLGCVHCREAEPTIAVTKALARLREAAMAAVQMYDRYCLHDMTIDEYDLGKALEGVRAALVEQDDCAVTPPVASRKTFDATTYGPAPSITLDESARADFRGGEVNVTDADGNTIMDVCRSLLPLDEQRGTFDPAAVRGLLNVIAERYYEERGHQTLNRYALAVHASEKKP